MASLLAARCTCEAFWRGRGARPQCPLHEAEDGPGDELEPGQARRQSDGRVVNVLATVGGKPGRPRDAEGMGGDTWRTWP